MAVEYIGDRYVPKFADPAEWDNTKAYEALTIVTNQGNSYTSKQAVPAGIDINSAAYWAETGNYNAQIEQYRNDVQRYADSVSSLKDNVTDLGEIANNGLLGNIMHYIVNNDDTIDVTDIIQTAINDTNVNGLYFPARKYIISESITIDSTKRTKFSINADIGAEFIANSAMSSIFTEIGTPADWHAQKLEFNGGLYNCNNLANSAITTINGTTRVINTSIYDYLTIGINVPSSHSSYIAGNYILQTSYNPDTPRTAISIGADSQIIGNKIFQASTGVLANGAILMYGNYLWSGTRKDNVIYTAIECGSMTWTAIVSASGNYFDSWNTLIHTNANNAAEISVTGNWIYSQAPNNMATVIYNIGANSKLKSVGNIGYQLNCTDSTKINYVVADTIIPASGFLEPNKLIIDYINNKTNYDDVSNLQQSIIGDSSIISSVANNINAGSTYVIGHTEAYAGEATLKIVLSNLTFTAIVSDIIKSVNVINGVTGMKIGTFLKNKRHYMYIKNTSDTDFSYSTVGMKIIDSMSTSTVLTLPSLYTDSYVPGSEINIY
jgi:hypothetical protein